MSESFGLWLRYTVDDSASNSHKNSLLQRSLVRLPLSWTVITRNELVPISVSDSSQPALPCNIWTVVPTTAPSGNLRCFCAHGGESRGRFILMRLSGTLCSMCGYSLFDVCYEVNYVDFLSDAQPLSAKNLL
ncbi:uncharacterized protein BCR38DRAFT_385092 [Pseudomassariella vexata]|uniref:Uncharacterized protein n=1 Tax=Pseudomassariella vexata TaxID=1141098 RepID=A0A1Y2EF96_9PEZI|nr:uncharacterized protein BCR38DRAFT_385092 [Pseudomassariella vexata]ORY70253.1 hypothetical protein BCR38DRAFT_385092 [Pseudomassariella vexata]